MRALFFKIRQIIAFSDLFTTVDPFPSAEAEQDVRVDPLSLIFAGVNKKTIIWAASWAMKWLKSIYIVFSDLRPIEIRVHIKVCFQMIDLNLNMQYVKGNVLRVQLDNRFSVVSDWSDYKLWKCSKVMKPICAIPVYHGHAWKANSSPSHINNILPGRCFSRHGYA